MKLKNTTDFEPWFLRRMLSWCCQQMKEPVRVVRSATFRNSRASYGGVARPWLRAITVCVGTPDRFPVSGGTMSDLNGHRIELADRLEALVWVTAHELAHIFQAIQKVKTRRSGAPGGSETATDWHARPVVEQFRIEREALLAQWSAPPILTLRAAAKPPLVEQRHQKAMSDLARWERKLKLARTKVSKLRQRVTYYQKRLQPCEPSSPSAS